MNMNKKNEETVESPEDIVNDGTQDNGATEQVKDQPSEAEKLNAVAQALAAQQAAEQAAVAAIPNRLPTLRRPASRRESQETALFPLVDDDAPGIQVECAWHIAQMQAVQRGRPNRPSQEPRTQRLTTCYLRGFKVQVIEDDSNKVDAMLTERYRTVKIVAYGDGPVRPPTGAHQRLSPDRVIGTFTAYLPNTGPRTNTISLSRGNVSGANAGEVILNIPTKGGSNPDWNSWQTSLESLLARPLRWGGLFNADGSLNDLGLDTIDDPDLSEEDKIMIEALVDTSTAQVLAVAHEVLVQNAKERAARVFNVAPEASEIGQERIAAILAGGFEELD